MKTARTKIPTTRITAIALIVTAAALTGPGLTLASLATLTLISAARICFDPRSDIAAHVDGMEMLIDIRRPSGTPRKLQTA